MFKSSNPSALKKGSNKEVVSSYVEGRDEMSAYGGNLYHSRGTLFSYDMPIACWVGGTLVIDDSGSVSTTTSRHISLVHSTASVEDVPRISFNLSWFIKQGISPANITRTGNLSYVKASGRLHSFCKFFVIDVPYKKKYVLNVFQGCTTHKMLHTGPRNIALVATDTIPEDFTHIMEGLTPEEVKPLLASGNLIYHHGVFLEMLPDYPIPSKELVRATPPKFLTHGSNLSQKILFTVLSDEDKNNPILYISTPIHLVTHASTRLVMVKEKICRMYRSTRPHLPYDCDHLVDEKDYIVTLPKR